MKIEIKFRAWDWEKMYNVERLDFYEKKIGIFEDIDWLYKDWDILMRYTWLKDKNWKEIYEWDIVRDWMWFQYEHWTLELKFYKIDWFGNKRDEIDFYPWFNFKFDTQNWQYISLEVIGNIYENQNLIDNWLIWNTTNN